MKKKIELFLFFLFFYVSSYATLSVADSLYMKLNQAGQDTIKAQLYIDLASHYSHNADSTYKYAEPGLELSREIGWKKGIVTCCLLLTTYYSYIDRSDQILRVCFEALKNEPNPRQRMTAYAMIHLLYRKNQEFDKALSYAFQALEELEGFSVEQAYTYMYIGETYFYKNQIDSAKYYFNQSFDLWDKVDMTTKNANAKISCLLKYNELIDDDPLERYKHVVEMKYLYEKYEVDNIIFRLSILFDYAKESLTLYHMEKIDEKLNKTKKELWNDSEYYFERANQILDSIDSPAMDDTYLEVLCQIYELKGDYKSAFFALEKLYKTDVDLYSQESKNKLAAVETERQAERYEHEISIKELEIKNRKKQQTFYIVGILLLLSIAALLVYYNQERKKKNEELAKANDLKNRLLGILNHDLRKPVASLIEYLRLVEKMSGRISEEQKKEMEKETLSQTEDLLQSMEELLAWTKSQMVHFTPEFRDVRISSLFDDLALMPGAKNLVDVRIDSNAVIHTDPNYMKTIIRNLTTNAVKAASEADNPSVSWQVTPLEKGFSFVITNNGKQMTEQQKDILLKGGTSENISQGFGLHIIHDFAKTIQGRIQMNDRPDGETEITLLI